MPNLNLAQLARGKVGLVFRRGWVQTYISFFLYNTDRDQLPSGAYGLSRAQCTDCHGHGEKLKEKERSDFICSF